MAIPIIDYNTLLNNIGSSIPPCLYNDESVVIQLKHIIVMHVPIFYCRLSSQLRNLHGIQILKCVRSVRKIQLESSNVITAGHVAR